MRPVLRSSLVAAALAAIFAVQPGAQAPAKTFPYDHIHLAVDGAQGSAWYEKNFGGKRITEAPNRIMYGSTRLMFLGARQNLQPSAGSAIDHIGFSVPDIDAKFKEFEANGVKIVQAPRDVPNLFKLGFVEDPWGTRIEVVQDAEMLGLHHIHMRAPNPEDTFTWLAQKFGGERKKLKGQLDAMFYRAPGFSDMWILVQRGEATPSQGHAIDHIGWRSEGDLKATMDGLKERGADIATQPRPLTLPAGPPINFAYVNGPSGAYIEIVERPGLKPGE
jgi:catechol 2,3-dioxygenase-like lactoylglutathione lyase family enzyme